MCPNNLDYKFYSDPNSLQNTRDKTSHKNVLYFYEDFFKYLTYGNSNQHISRVYYNLCDFHKIKLITDFLNLMIIFSSNTSIKNKKDLRQIETSRIFKIIDSFVKIGSNDMNSNISMCDFMDIYNPCNSLMNTYSTYQIDVLDYENYPSILDSLNNSLDCFDILQDIKSFDDLNFHQGNYRYKFNDTNIKKIPSISAQDVMDELADLSEQITELFVKDDNGTTLDMITVNIIDELLSEIEGNRFISYGGYFAFPYENPRYIGPNISTDLNQKYVVIRRGLLSMEICFLEDIYFLKDILNLSDDV